MQHLKKPNEHILGLLGKQCYDPHTEYRLLNFCLVLQHDNRFLLYNNLTKEFIVLSPNEFSTLNSSNFTSSLELTKKLVEQWFLVPKKYDDLKLCDQIRSVIRNIHKVGIYNYTILPTTGCNARCFYCFEAGAKVSNMTEQTALDVADYIINHCNNNLVNLNWFGGEPLCNEKAIDNICGKLSENKIEYFSHITTNGYLFDNEAINKYKNIWHLISAQITLDGLENTYNRIKNYVNDKDQAFQKVINNIELLVKNQINVHIRLNIDNYNISEMHRLVDFLNERFFEYKEFIAIYGTPIYEDENKEETLRNEHERLLITDNLVKLTTQIQNLGFKTRSVKLDEIKCTACQADSPNFALILPDGHLGFCEHFVDKDFYGTIYDDLNKPMWSEYSKHKEKCRTCVALPNCITLKKCPNETYECLNYNQYIRISSLENGVRLYYEKNKK